MGAGEGGDEAGGEEGDQEDGEGEGEVERVGIEAKGVVFTGGTAMSDAVIFAQWRASRRLLERGAKTTFSQAAALGLVERMDEPATAEELTKSLWHACRGGSLAVVQKLVARGADPHWLGWDGLTPLTAAEKAGRVEVVRWLRSKGQRGTLGIES